MTALLLADLRLQRRGGFWAVYAVVATALAALLRILPPPASTALLPVALLLDPAILGLTVAGVLVLLERQQGVLRAVGTTPLGVDAWLAVRVASLTLLALVACAAAAIGAGRPPHPGLLLLGVVPVSAFCVLLAVGVAARVRTTTGFLFWIQVAALPPSLAFGEVLLGWEGAWLRGLPTGAALELLRGASGFPLGAASLARDLLVLSIWTGAAWLWARRSAKRFLLGRAAGGSP